MRPNRSSDEIAERLLILTLSLAEAIESNRLGEIGALLDSRQSAIDELQVEGTLSTTRLNQIHEAELRLMRICEAERLQAASALHRSHEIRVASRTYGALGGRETSAFQSSS